MFRQFSSWISQINFHFFQTKKKEIHISAEAGPNVVSIFIGLLILYLYYTRTNQFENERNIYVWAVQKEPRERSKSTNKI